MSAATGRVLLISQTPPPVHGSTIVTQQLLAELAAQGKDVSIVDRRFSRHIGQVGRFSLRKALCAPVLLLRLIRSLRSEKPAVVVFFVTNRPASFVVDVVMALVLTLWRTPYIAYVHTVGFRSLAARGYAWKRMCHWLLGRATRTVTLGTSLRADIAPFVTSTSVVIPNAALGPSILPEKGDESCRRVLFLSNRLRHKGPVEFVQLAANLKSEGFNAEFVLAGNEVDASVEAEIDSVIRLSGLEGTLSRSGRVSPERRWDVLANADILVFPSIYPYEAQPLVIIEAAGMGVPTVAYDIGGIADIVENGVTGVLVPPGCLDALTDAVAELLRDPERLDSMGRAARVRHDFDVSARRFGAQWGAVIDEVLA